MASGVATANGEYAEAVVDWLTVASGVGVLTRAHVSLAGVARGYTALFNGTTAFILRLDNSSTFTTLTSVAHVPTAGTHTYKIVATDAGASVVVDLYADGALLLTVTDSSASRITTFGSCGVYFDSVRSDSTGAHMTSIVQEDPNAGGAGGLTLLTPTDGQIFQRAGSIGTITVTGTYIGTPTSIEARLVLDGGSTSVAGYDWATKVASPAGGVFAFTFTAVPEGVWYNVQIRDSAVPATVVASTETGVGALVPLIGQSNAWLWFARGDSTLTPDVKLRVIGSGGDNGIASTNAPKVWAVPATATMNGCIAFGNRLATTLNTLIGVIDVTWDGSGLNVTGNGGRWLPIATAGQPYDRAKTFLNTITAKVEAFVVVNGETDGANGQTQAQFYANMGTLITALRGDFGVSTTPIITPLLAKRSSSITDANAQAIRNAQVQKAGDTAIYRLERTDLTMNADGVHHDAPGYTTLGTRCAQALLFALGAAAFYRGPQLASAVLVTSTVFDVTLTHASGNDITPASAITGFRVLDTGTPVAISSAVRQSANQVRLTLGSAPATLPTIQYMYGTAPVVTGVVRDNSTLTLPLEFNDGVVVTNGPTIPPPLATNFPITRRRARPRAFAQ